MKADVYCFGMVAWETANDGHRFFTANPISLDAQEVGKALGIPP